jgi:hypothetical protein
MAKMWLMVYHPFHRPGGRVVLPQETKDRLFITSIEIIEYSRLLETEAATSRWGWLLRTYVQWQAVAIILSELCIRDYCPVVERAWKAVEGTFDDWGETVKPKNGMLWRPLKTLMAKAKIHRDETRSMQMNVSNEQSIASSSSFLPTPETGPLFESNESNIIGATMSALDMPIPNLGSLYTSQQLLEEALGQQQQQQQPHQSHQSQQSPPPQSQQSQQPQQQSHHQQHQSHPPHQHQQANVLSPSGIQQQFQDDMDAQPPQTGQILTMGSAETEWFLDDSVLMDLRGGQQTSWLDWDEMVKDYQLNGNSGATIEREPSGEW